MLEDGFLSYSLRNELADNLNNQLKNIKDVKLEIENMLKKWNGLHKKLLSRNKNQC